MPRKSRRGQPLMAPEVRQAMRARLHYWGALIWSARRRRKVSQATLAAVIPALSTTTLSALETVHALETGALDTNPDPAVICAVADYLGIPRDILGVGEPTSTLARLCVLLQSLDPVVTEDVYRFVELMVSGAPGRACRALLPACTTSTV